MKRKERIVVELIEIENILDSVLDYFKNSGSDSMSKIHVYGEIIRNLVFIGATQLATDCFAKTGRLIPKPDVEKGKISSDEQLLVACLVVSRRLKTLHKRLKWGNRGDFSAYTKTGEAAAQMDSMTSAVAAIIGGYDYIERFSRLIEASKLTQDQEPSPTESRRGYV